MKPHKKKGPPVPAMTSAHQQHPVRRDGNGNVAVRHPSVPGPNMMAPMADHAELPSGSMGTTQPGGIIGGLAPFQTAKGAEMGDFQP